MRLLLFDIDGTLLTVDGAGASAITQALSDQFGRPISVDGVSFSGRTDPSILRDVLAQNGIEPSEERIRAALDAYTAAAQDTIRPEHVRPLPGVEDLLSLLSARDDMHLALVTGNVEAVAYHKLQTAGLGDYFSVGAFGSDSAERSDLPPLARRRATDRTGQSFVPDAVFVVGDTPHDIQCARASGFRSMAVSTGTPDRRTLHRHDPDLLLKNLSDPKPLLDILGRGPDQS